MALLINLPTDLLRTFITVVELGDIPRPGPRWGAASLRSRFRSAGWKRW
ncbi:hypothetical protein ACFSHQ_23835 [Gemmobacter lanyuensis]